MFEIRANCDNRRCPAGVFIVERRKVVKRSTSGQEFTINQVVCPECRMWAKVTRIKEKRDGLPDLSGGRRPGKPAH